MVMTDILVGGYPLTDAPQRVGRGRQDLDPTLEIPSKICTTIALHILECCDGNDRHFSGCLPPDRHTPTVGEREEQALIITV